MELWVRSQNKEYLIDARELAYGENFRVPCVLAFIRNTSRILGRYHTKERALEVLDEIQRLIEDLQYMSYAIVNDKFASYRPNVYQMPKE